jgi:xylulokinase
LKERRLRGCTMSYMGLDIGTTGCKAAVYSLEGFCLSQEYREYVPIQEKAGQGELDSHEVLACCLKVIQKAAAEAAEPVEAISFSSMGEAVVPVSKSGRLLSTSILSSDARGKNYLNKLLQVNSEELFRINPNIPGVNYSYAKICWLRDNKPDIYEQTWKFLTWGDLLAFVLTGEAVTTPSMANRTMLFDIAEEQWSTTLFSVVDLDVKKFPAIIPSGTVLGTILPEMAENLSLSSHVRVVTGGHDQSLNALGSGCFSSGKAVSGMGTVQCITPVMQGLPNLERMRKMSLNVEHHVLPGLYVSFLYNQSGSLVKWFRNTWAKNEKESMSSDLLYTKLFQEMPDNPTSLISIPFFEPAGAPSFEVNGFGSIIGLKTTTKRGEILKSILEGAAYFFINSLKQLEELGCRTESLIATGGGAKSDSWLQIQADIFGKPIERPIVTEAGTLGAALLAALAVGKISSGEEGFNPFSGVEKTFFPNFENHTRYLGLYDRYLSFFKAVEPFFNRITIEEN